MDIQAEIDAIEAKRSQLGEAGVRSALQNLAKSHGLQMVETEVTSDPSASTQQIGRHDSPPQQQQCKTRRGCSLTSAYVDINGLLHCVYDCIAMDQGPNKS